MVSHFIIMSSSYSEGTRIALDIKEDKELNTEYISEIIKGIKILAVMTHQFQHILFGQKPALGNQSSKRICFLKQLKL
ncbi:MAG: hypothetical protein RUMPE_00934 [Eubacteriales bacterium SKADARSKE-1]|nr:hypothetical protein [Eubacteriales bacterium SKADARSKE-1]